jgi:hypothetical protein
MMMTIASILRSVFDSLTNADYFRRERTEASAVWLDRYARLAIQQVEPEFEDDIRVEVDDSGENDDVMWVEMTLVHEKMEWDEVSGMKVNTLMELMIWGTL